MRLITIEAAATMLRTRELSFYRLQQTNNASWRLVFNATPERRCTLAHADGRPVNFSAQWNALQAAYTIGFPKLAPETEARIRRNLG